MDNNKVYFAHARNYSDGHFHKWTVIAENKLEAIKDIERWMRKTWDSESYINDAINTLTITEHGSSGVVDYLFE